MRVIRKYCLFCEKDISKRLKGTKYCSSNCGQSFFRHGKRKEDIEWCINCVECGKIKERKKIDGRTQFCSAKCQGLNWIKRNKNHYQKMNRKWYEKNREEKLIKNKEWREENKESYKKLQSDWYFKNKKLKRQKERENYHKKPLGERRKISKKKNKIFLIKYRIKENKRRKKLGLPLIGKYYKRELELKVIIERIFNKKCIYRGYYILSKNKRLLQVSTGRNNEGKRQLDIYFPKLKIAFEYDGEQHYEDKTGWIKDSLEIIQKRDRETDKICKKAGVRLIRIPYWTKLTGKNITNKIKIEGCI